MSNNADDFFMILVWKTIDKFESDLYNVIEL